MLALAIAMHRYTIIIIVVMVFMLHHPWSSSISVASVTALHVTSSRNEQCWNQGEPLGDCYGWGECIQQSLSTHDNERYAATAANITRWRCKCSARRYDADGTPCLSANNEWPSCARNMWTPDPVSSWLPTGSIILGVVNWLVCVFCGVILYRLHVAHKLGYNLSTIALLFTFSPNFLSGLFFFLLASRNDGYLVRASEPSHTYRLSTLEPEEKPVYFFVLILPNTLLITAYNMMFLFWRRLTAKTLQPNVKFLSGHHMRSVIGFFIAFVILDISTIFVDDMLAGYILLYFVWQIILAFLIFRYGRKAQSALMPKIAPVTATPSTHYHQTRALPTGSSGGSYDNNTNNTAENNGHRHHHNNGITTVVIASIDLTTMDTNINGGSSAGGALPLPLPSPQPALSSPTANETKPLFTSHQSHHQSHAGVAGVAAGGATTIQQYHYQQQLRIATKTKHLAIGSSVVSLSQTVIWVLVGVGNTEGNAYGIMVAVFTSGYLTVLWSLLMIMSFNPGRVKSPINTTIGTAAAAGGGAVVGSGTATVGCAVPIAIITPNGNGNGNGNGGNGHHYQLPSPVPSPLQPSPLPYSASKITLSPNGIKGRSGPVAAAAVPLRPPSATATAISPSPSSPHRMAFVAAATTSATAADRRSPTLQPTTSRHPSQQQQQQQQPDESMIQLQLPLPPTTITAWCNTPIEAVSTTITAATATATPAPVLLVSSTSSI